MKGPHGKGHLFLDHHTIDFIFIILKLSLNDPLQSLFKLIIFIKISIKSMSPLIRHFALDVYNENITEISASKTQDIVSHFRSLLTPSLCIYIFRYLSVLYKVTESACLFEHYHSLCSLIFKRTFLARILIRI